MTLRETIDLSFAYNHNRALKDAKEGQKIIDKSERELHNMKTEISDIKIGDEVETTNTAIYKEGTKGKVVDIEMNGKFISFKVDFTTNPKARKRNIQFCRKQDIRKV